jgi:tRNA nucleotidyltransferase/poly(A) polymerase
MYNETVFNFMKEFQKRIPNSEIFMVGGCVRDELMGKEPSDYDFATNVSVEEVEKHFNCADIGKSKDFGIVCVSFEGEAYEVAQYRSEDGYSDNRHPDSVKLGVSIEEDAKRRDFTINAMFKGVDGKIHDFHNGRNHMFSQTIRAVGNADERIKEDALRILRAVRFAVTFNFAIEARLHRAIKENRELINTLSQERITGEILKVADKGGKVFYNWLKSLQELDLFEIVFPELQVMDNYKQFWLHHPEGCTMKDTVTGQIKPLVIDQMEDGSHVLDECGTVLEHMMSVMSMVPEDADVFLVLSALWHDIGKPISAEIKDDSTGTSSFKRHEYKGVAVFEELAKKRKIGGTLARCIEFCIAEHMNMNNKELSKKSTIIDLALSPFFDILAEVSRADDRSRNVNGNILYVKEEFDKNLQKFHDARDAYTDQRTLKDNIAKFIDGNKVMRLCNIKPSRKVGEIIGEVTEFLIENEFSVDVEVVDDMIKNLASDY